MSTKLLSKTELRGLNDSELTSELRKNKHELLKSKLELGLSQLKDTSALKKLRKHIARTKTLQNEFKKTSPAAKPSPKTSLSPSPNNLAI